MVRILNIDTSTTVCSVSLTENGKTVISKESFEDKSHATELTIMIQKIFDEVKIKAKDLNAVAISKGPGSYTGLRIGVSTAKGICYAADIPLISVDTLKIIAVNALPHLSKEGIICSMIDARRMEVYMAMYNTNLLEIKPVSAEIIEPETFQSHLDKENIFFCGSGAEKCKEIIVHKNAYFIDDIHPLAKSMEALSLKAFESKSFENVAYFEPFYLKDFVATKPKNKLI